MRVACVQVLTDNNLEKNLTKVKKLILKAIKQKADLIITPEVSSVFSFDKKNLLKELQETSSVNSKSLASNKCLLAKKQLYQLAQINKSFTHYRWF